MFFIINEKIKKNAFLTDEFTDLITSSLNPQELKVIVNRFGLVDGILRTQKEVGKFLGISSQRVSQIESKATKKIKIARSLENLFEKYFFRVFDEFRCGVVFQLYESPRRLPG